MELASIQNLTFTYPEQETAVLSDVSLTLRPGDFAVLAGPSGCGKSTLLRQLKTVLAPHGQRVCAYPVSFFNSSANFFSK